MTQRPDRLRVTSATAPVLTPTHGQIRLPAWQPLPPPTGWTPVSALAAAEQYADTAPHGLAPRTAALAAFEAIRRADPRLSRTHIEARLRGDDVLAKFRRYEPGWLEYRPVGARPALDPAPF